jgi:hypothetical protein
MTRAEELEQLFEKHQPLTPEKVEQLKKEGLLTAQEVRFLSDGFSNPQNFRRSG